MESVPESTCTGCRVRTTDVSRRDFVSQAALAAIAISLTACGGDDDIPTTGPIPPVAGTLAVTLASFPDLSVVGGVARVSGSPPVAMARTNSGLVAYSLSCTHTGTTVTVNANRTLRCPNHGAEFAFDGTWTGGTQRTTSLIRLPTVLNAESTVATITLG
jgi:nitrite reductase/ring-hydroxylating ferredoxin subunit